MKKIFLCLLIGSLLIVSSLLVSATKPQKTDKPWTQWSKKEAEKILSDSPWAQVQTETDTAEMFFSPTSDPRRWTFNVE
jgi:hypothetical protein